MPRKNILLGSLPAIVVGIGVAAVAIAAVNGITTPAPLTARIVLDRSHVQLGGVVTGKVVFENRTSKPKVMLRGCDLNGLYTVVLSSAHGGTGSDGSGAIFGTVGCLVETPADLMVAKPGRTVYRFRIPAVHTACGPCAIGSPLPAGNYAIVFFPDGTWRGPTVTSATVTLTKTG